VTALLQASDQSALGQLTEMTARRLRRDACGIHQFTGGERPSAHQRGQNIGAHRIADERRDFCDANVSRHAKLLSFITTPRKCNTARSGRHPQYYGRGRTIRG
jgi:hypothetical protein